MYSSVACGLLVQVFLFYQGWEYMFLCTGTFGLIWSIVLRCLSHKQKRKMHYQLLDSSTSASSTAKSKSIKVNLEKKEVSCVEVPWKSLVKQPPIL